VSALLGVTGNPWAELGVDMFFEWVATYESGNELADRKRELGKDGTVFPTFDITTGTGW